MSETPEREIINGNAYVIPSLSNLTAVQRFVSDIIRDTALPVTFTVDTSTMRAEVKIGRSPNSLRVPDRGVIVIIRGIVYAIDSLTVNEVGADLVAWGAKP